MEMPAIASSSYASNALNLNDLVGGNVVNAFPLQQAIAAQQMALLRNPPAPIKEKAIMANQRRLVQVFIADPNENVPLDACLLYKGDAKLTDLTDQELFFEIDVKNVLDAHNEKRIKLVNKVVKERTEYLEPARIRDLKMTVVTIAQF